MLLIRSKCSGTLRDFKRVGEGLGVRESPSIADWAGSTYDVATAYRLDAEEVCAICLQDLRTEPCVGFTLNGSRTCTHLLHTHCAQQLLYSGNPTAHCPICVCEVD